MEFYIKSYNELCKEELYEILKVRNEVFVVEQECPYQDCDGKDKHAYHLYIIENNKIIGYLRILNKGISYDEVSIGRVLVHKNHRNKGIGRKLMQKAIDHILNEMKEYDIRISAQVYLLDFYSSLGFKTTSKEYLEDDIPHIEMLYSKTK